MSSNPKCYFNYKTLTAKVGNYTKGYEELECIQVPTFKRTILEKESLKNGWYGTKQLENLGKNIIKNNIVIITLWKWLETKNLIKQILNTYEKFI